MERKQKLIANYSQQGYYMYPEDTWDDSIVIENEKDLLLACKEWYKLSARGFNNYPFGGLFSIGYVSFETQNIIIDDNGEIFYGELKECGVPEYFDDVKEKFNEWLIFIKDRVPKLREARKKRLKEEEDRKKFEELSMKYGT